MKAEKLFVDVMQRQIAYKGVSQDDNSIIAMSLKLAVIFSKSKQYEKAQQGFEFCINTTENKIKSGNGENANFNYEYYRTTGALNLYLISLL